MRAAIARQEKPTLLQRPALMTSAFIWTIMVFVVGAITWSVVAQIDQSVPAMGKLEPKGGNKPVKAPSGGVVREVLVKPGDRVEKGQLLVTFDPTAPEADIKSLQAGRASLVRQRDLLLSEASGAPVGGAQVNMVELRRNRESRLAENQYYRSLLSRQAPPDPAQLPRLRENLAAQASRDAELRSQAVEIEAQMSALRAQVAQQQAQIGPLQSQVGELQKSADDLAVQQASLQDRLAKARERLKINEGIIADLTPLVQEGAIPRLQYKNQQQSVLSNVDNVQSFEGQIASIDQQRQRIAVSIQTKLAEIRAKVADVRAKAREIDVKRAEMTTKQRQRNTTDSSWSADIENRIAANEREIADIDTQLARVSIDNSKQLATISGQLAQIDGQITKAQQANRFQELRSPVAGKVFDIKASGPGYVANATEPILTIVPDENLEASVYVTNKDIGFIEVGMPVEINIDSFPSLEFGHIKGKLTSIGSDALPPQPPDRPTYVFPITVQLDNQVLKTNNGKEFKIQAGMSVSARIKTRKRSVIDIFFGQFKSRADSFETVR